MKLISIENQIQYNLETISFGKPSIGISDKEKSILSKERTNDWNADDRFEDGYKDNMISKKNQQASEKGCDTDYAATSKSHTDRIPLQSLFKGKILRKRNRTINRDPFFKELSKSIINSSISTVQLSDGKIIRKSDIAIPKSNSTKIRSFTGNFSFPYFPNINVEVGQKHESSRRQSKSR